MSNTGAIAEHGLSILLETDEGNFLFDTGQGKAIINNSRILGKKLSGIKGVFLSHHHYDHTGGLLDVLHDTGPVKVYAHPELFKDSYSMESDGTLEHIGIPFSKTLLENKGAQFHFNTDWQEIVPGLFLTGEIPRKTSFEEGDNSLIIKTKEGNKQDLIMDDQSLIISKEDGLFIILGCAHAGIINIINYAIEKTGQSHIKAVIGGTHLGYVDKRQLDESIKALKEFDIEKIGVSHCTGLRASMRLGNEFGDKFFFCNVGTIIEA